MKCERAFVGDAGWAVAIAAKTRLMVSFFMVLFLPPRAKSSSRQSERDHRLLGCNQNILFPVSPEVGDGIRERVRGQFRFPKEFPGLRFVRVKALIVRGADEQQAASGGDGAADVVRSR